MVHKEVDAEVFVKGALLGEAPVAERGGVLVHEDPVKVPVHAKVDHLRGTVVAADLVENHDFGKDPVEGAPVVDPAGDRHGFGGHRLARERRLGGKDVPKLPGAQALAQLVEVRRVERLAQELEQPHGPGPELAGFVHQERDNLLVVGVVDVHVEVVQDVELVVGRGKVVRVQRLELVVLGQNEDDQDLDDEDMEFVVVVQLPVVPLRLVKRLRVQREILVQVLLQRVQDRPRWEKLKLHVGAHPHPHPHVHPHPHPHPHAHSHSHPDVDIDAGPGRRGPARLSKLHHPLRGRPLFGGVGGSAALDRHHASRSHGGRHCKRGRDTRCVRRVAHTRAPVGKTGRSAVLRIVPPGRLDQANHRARGAGSIRRDWPCRRPRLSACHGHHRVFPRRRPLVERQVRRQLEPRDHHHRLAQSVPLAPSAPSAPTLPAAFPAT